MRDIAQEVTDKIIARIEQGNIPWHPSWNTKASFAMPKNATTGKGYQGINVLSLWIAAEDNAFPVQEWGTYKQWQEQKEQVKKGAKGTQIIYYDVREIGEGDDAKEIPFIKASTVFNRSQLESFVPAENPQGALIDRLEHVDRYLLNTGAKILHDGGNRAFYRRSTDEIHLPARDAFKDSESLYSVTLHELTHWTGAETRLNRTKGKKFGDKEYAFEELVAELGAAFNCAALGITNTPRDDHAAYIENWLEVLKGDKKAIFTAASEASKAVSYLDGLQP